MLEESLTPSVTHGGGKCDGAGERVKEGSFPFCEDHHSIMLYYISSSYSSSPKALLQMMLELNPDWECEDLLD